MVERITKVNINIRVVIMLTILGTGMISGIIMDSFLGWLFILVGISALVFHIYIVSMSESDNVNSIVKFNDTFVRNSKIKYDDYFYGEDGGTILLINENEKLIHLFTRSKVSDEYTVNKIQFSQIIESGIIEDGQTIIKTSKSGIIGGSLIGGILAGGFGSVVGALASDKSSSEQVKKVTLSIVVDNLLNPVHDIVFFIVENPTTKDNAYYKKMLEKCTLWHKRMSVIIKRNEN